MIAALASFGAARSAVEQPEGRSTGGPPRAPATQGAEPRAARGLDLVVLSNGFRVILVQARSNPMVASTVAVLAGLRDETPETNGASHFLEHLLFNGTTKRTQERLYEDVDMIGGYNNATTRDEYTLYQFLAHRDYLPQALDIQSDMLFHSTLPEETFEKERRIVLEEIARDESDPAYEAHRFYRRCYYAEDPRSMPILGTKKSIEALTRKAVLGHYRSFYRPDRMVMLLAGDFDRAEALRLLERTFGSAGKGGGEAGARRGGPEGEAGVTTTGSEPGKGTQAAVGSAGQLAPDRTGKAAGSEVGRREARHRRRGRSAAEGRLDSEKAAGGAQPAESASQRAGFVPPRPGFYKQRFDAGRGYLYFGFPAPGAGDPDAPAAAALAAYLGSGSGSRLARALAAVERTEVIEASAGHVAGSNGGRFEIAVTLAPHSTGEETVAAIVHLLARLAREPLAPEEVESLIIEERSSDLYLRDQVHYLGMAVASDLILAPSPSLGPGAEVLAALTPERMRSVAERWLMRPAVAALSSPAVPPDADAGRPLPLPSPAAVVEAPARQPRPIASHTAVEAQATRRIDFENGLTLLVADNPDSEIFAAHLLVRDRAAVEPEGQTGIADLLHRMLPYGSLILDGEGLALKLKALGARLKTVDDPNIPYDDYYTSPRYSFVRFETIRENWREGLGLLFTTVSFPRLYERDLALALSEEIDLSRRGTETPLAVARRLYSGTVVKNGPLSRPVTGSPITLGSIKPEDVADFHGRYFSPDQLILSIVSNVPSSDVIEVVSASFGAAKPGPGAPALAPLKPGEPRRRASRLAEPPVTAAAERVETAAGREQSQILMGRVFAREPAELAPLIVATTVLSGKISRDLREKRGLAYSVGCSVEDFGPRAWFTASMGTRPENLEAAEEALREAIRRFPVSDLDEADVRRAVSVMRGQVAMRRMTRISQAFALGFNEFLGREPGFDAELDAALSAVTAEQIRDVARRHFDPDRMVTAVAR